MSVRIHHATAKRAQKFGIVLAIDADGDTLTASFDGRILARGHDPKVVLAEAERQLNPDSPRKARTPKSPAKAKKARKAARKSRKSDEDGEDEDGEDEEQEDEGASVVKRKYKKAYRPFKQTCGDELSGLVSAHLRVVNEDTGEDYLCPKRLKEFAKLNDCWQPGYATLNIGMQRMNVVNRLRAKIKHDDKYRIRWPA